MHAGKQKQNRMGNRTKSVQTFYMYRCNSNIFIGKVIFILNLRIIVKLLSNNEMKKNCEQKCTLHNYKALGFVGFDTQYMQKARGAFSKIHDKICVH